MLELGAETVVTLMMKSNAKERIKRLFHFLKQFNNIKNPIITDVNNQVWRKWLDNIPRHQCIANNIYRDEKEGSQEILKVGRPVLTDCPIIPSSLIDWVEKGWDNIYGEIKVKKEIKILQRDHSNQTEKYTIEKFEDSKERVNDLIKWEKDRNAWLKEEIPARAADELFNSFYGLYSNIKKEAGELELILGDGNLLYKRDVYVDHPILLHHVKLEFDADVPEFKLTYSDKGVEIYRSVLYYIEDVNNELLKDIYNDFEENNYSPIELEKTNSFLNRMANALSPRGNFAESKECLHDNLQYPQIYRRPVLFLRKRNLGYGVALDTIIGDINISNNIPSFLKEVVGVIEEKPLMKETIFSARELNPKGIDEEILLTKEANAEQLAVAKFLEKNSAVLVQGPPGTGKTHTIANLIGHFLAQGKSILVTSSSEKALSVLKSKVHPSLQSLCLSLLSSTESRQEMEKNLDEINEIRSRLNPMVLKKQIEDLETKRKNQIKELDELKLKLKNTRLNEYRAIVVNGVEYKPIDAAKYLSQYKDSNSWIPMPVEQGVGIPLTEDEIIDLYRTNSLISSEEEIEYSYNRPKLENLLSPIEFERIILEKGKFTEGLYRFAEYWEVDSLEKYKPYSIEELKTIIAQIKRAVSSINFDKEWTLEVMEASREKVRKEAWLNLIDEINYVYNLSLTAMEDLIKYNPEFKVVDEKVNLKRQLENIVEKIQASGKITRLNLLLNPEMKTTINSCIVNGRVPKNLNEYKALLKYYDLNKAREQLANRWNRQMAPLGADNSRDMGEDFELVCKKYCKIIEENLYWYENLWNPLIARLKHLGLRLELIDNNMDLSKEKYSRLKYIKNFLADKIIEVLESEIYRLKFRKLKRQLEDYDKFLNGFTHNQSSVFLKGLREALIEENPESYREYYEALERLESLSEIIKRRRDLLNTLRESAPNWAKEIENRNSLHGREKPPTGIKEAWLYIQFKQEIIERKRQSLEDIQNQIFKLEDSLKKSTAELAYKKAWGAKLIKFQHNKKQVQAIEGWRQLIRKIGNGKGKKAELYKAEARKLMPSCQGAIPVWIMPLNKVVESFNPVENRFDIVIIDEASQSDVMALTALYLGEKAIIVGDNEQVSPLSIGERTEDMDRLIREYLYDIPNDKLYSGKFSLYDLAQASGYQPIRLKEHFRCVPEIIQYSNILSYNGQIKPLRDDSQVTVKPALVPYRVEGAISKNKVNEKEAETIVSLILACCQQEEYKDKTIGVITLRGDKQATAIDRMLQKRMEPSEYSKREILCGNSANFQGDERDIIFLSMVDTNEGEGPLRFNGYGPEDLFKKRYNVAVSRAKDQIWLVYSLDAEEDLKAGDIRKELIAYFKNPHGKDIEYKKVSMKAESEFEKEVMKGLINKGYKIVPQWQVGSYRIDMVAIYGDKKVAIECDGERWHGEDKFEEDMVRQSILERLGWTFIRIRGSQFYSDKETTIVSLSNKLQELDIYPHMEGNSSLQESKYILIDKVKQAALKLRKSWR